MAIHLLPCPIIDGELEQIPVSVITQTHELKVFVVERAKTARHYLKAIKHPIPLPEILIFELDKHDPERGLYDFLSAHAQKSDIGVLSEAGCPAIADPGSKVVWWAHQQGVKVVPHVGPSSIILALMASGMDGQQFAFHGYLPAKKPQLQHRLKELEKQSLRYRQTQIFIEAPYRNGFMLETCLKTLNSQTRLCIALDLTATTEEIHCHQVKNWPKVDLALFHKRPAVFLLMG